MVDLGEWWVCGLWYERMGWGRIGVERSGKVNEQVGLKEMSYRRRNFNAFLVLHQVVLFLMRYNVR